MDVFLVIDNVVVMLYNVIPMHKNAEEKIRKLTQNQAKVLKAVMFPNINVGTVVPGSYISGASGLRQNALGGTVSALERNDIISPFGRDNRQYNWELTDADLITAKEEDPKTLKNMLNRIAGEDKK